MSSQLNKVLYVDDDDEIRALVEMALGIGGFQVKLCSSGAEALQTAPSYRPDIILLDVMMPGMDGPTTLKKLQDDPDLSDIPVVFMTAAREVSALRKLGVAGILFKPFDTMKLAEQVREVWRKHRQTPVAPAEDKQRGSKPIPDSDQLHRLYKEKLPGKLHTMQSLWSRLLHLDWNSEVLDKLINHAHKLKGSGASYGYREISSISGEIESLLREIQQNRDVPEEAQRHLLDRMFQRLQDQIAGQTEHSGERLTSGGKTLTDLTQPPQTTGYNKLIYLAEDDDDIAAWLSLHLRQFGYLVQLFTNPQDLVAACKARQPDAILSDIVFPEGDDAGLATIGPMLRKQPIPTLFLSGRADIRARVLALRTGAKGYLMKPVDISLLLSKLEEVLGGNMREPYRVLVIDDDESSALLHAKILEQAGMRCEVLTNPLKLMQPLLGFRPELILTDLHMPNINGFELAQIIRQEEAFANTPIFFLSADANDSNYFKSATLGGDYYLHKSIAADELVSITTSRLQRVRAVNRRIEYMARRDPVSGVLNRAWFNSELERVLWDVSNTPAAVISLVIDNYQMLADSLAQSQVNQYITELAQILREHLSEGDLMGRYSDNNFVFYLRRANHSDIARVAKQLLECGHKEYRFAEGLKINNSFSIGVQHTDGRPSNTLLSVARFLSRRAYNAGGDRIFMDETGLEKQEEYQNEQLYIQAIRNPDMQLPCEFRLLYQPAVSLKEGAPFCFDTLLRLYDSQGAQYPHNELLQTARTHNLLHQLDQRTLELALHSLQQGQLSQGTDVLLVNLYMNTLQQKEVVEQSLKKVAAPETRQRLVLMFSLDEIQADLPRFQSEAKQLEKLGYSVGIDIFEGSTGALQLLKLLPLDYIKLSRGFTEGLEQNAERQKSFELVLQRSHEQGIKVIAGYVERASTIVYLSESEIDYIQGSFLHEPTDDVSLEVITMDADTTRSDPIWMR